MKKLFLVLFIVFDLALIGTALFVLYGYVTHHGQMPSLTARPKAVSTNPAAGTASSAPTTASPAKAIGGGLLNPAVPSDSSTRKILFTYRNAHARLVAIRADFTGWKAQPMTKASNGSWTYLAQLTPGEYAYCFTADDKTFKDPANKRTKLIGRTTVSAIMVEARPAQTSK